MSARTARLRGGAVAVTCSALLIAGCGGGVSAADLFVVNRIGPGAQRLTMLVDEEGNVRCDGRAAGKLDDTQIVLARGIQEELHNPASAHLVLPPRPASVITYEARDEAGTVRFSDNSVGEPKALSQLALFVEETARQLCHVG